MTDLGEHITLLHGSGGRATGELIKEVFSKAFNSKVVDAMEDAAVVDGSARIAITTDSFVVNPIFYPGGDIGRLAVCGSVNDLLARGAIPKYLTCGFIIEEGFLIEDLKRIASSMADTAKEAGIKIVAGDTKVVEGSGGIYINTTGVGLVEPGIDISAKYARPGDVIILSGNLGDHHTAIMSERLGIESKIQSDNAPLTEMVLAVKDMGVHTVRDVTRGGLATVLCELAEASSTLFYIDEEKLPVSDSVRDFCGILGLDPLYMGNEGKMVFIVEKERASEVLGKIRGCAYGSDACIVGEVVAPDGADFGNVTLRTSIGGMRRLDVLQDEGLPRIC